VSDAREGIEAGPGAEEDRGSVLEMGLGLVLLRHGLLLVALLVLVIAFSIATSRFYTPGNLMNILQQIAVNAILAFGMTFPIIIGGIDLSVGSIHGMTGRAAAWMLLLKLPEAAALPASLAVGAAFGVANGAVISFTRVAPFIVTLGTMSIGRGVAYIIENGRPLGVAPGARILEGLGPGRLAGAVPYPVLLMALLFLIAWITLHRTRFGHRVHAVGGNREAARNVGIRIRPIELGAYAISGACAAVTGVLETSLVLGAAPEAGRGYELDAIAAVVIGGASFTGGIGTMGGTLIGALLIGVLSNGLNLIGMHSFYQYVIKGAVILGAVLLDTMRKR